MLNIHKTFLFILLIGNIANSQSDIDNAVKYTLNLNRETVRSGEVTSLMINVKFQPEAAYGIHAFPYQGNTKKICRRPDFFEIHKFPYRGMQMEINRRQGFCELYSFPCRGHTKGSPPEAIFLKSRHSLLRNTTGNRPGAPFFEI